MIPFFKYFEIIEEDLQSSINQSKKILKSNNFSEKFADQIAEIVSDISTSEQLDNQQKRFNTDSNIPILTYLLITNFENGNPPLITLKSDYLAYLNSPRATGQNILVNAFNELKNTIQQNKWFKPSDEKGRYIWEWGNRLISKIHEYQVVENERVELNKDDTEDIVYSDDKITVYRADSKNKCIKYGAGSSLCISVKGGGNYYWSYRMGNMRSDGLGMTTYFVFWNDGSNRILIDALGDEDGPANEYSWNPITPNTDRDITDIELIEKYPELKKPFSKKVFQFIPYSDKEYRFMEIDKKIFNIEDNRLVTFEDYEMFIETGKKVTKIEFDSLSKKLAPEQMSLLYKKYIWNLKRIAHRDLVLKYLSNSDILKYDNMIIKSNPKKQLKYYLTFDNLPEDLIFNILKKQSNNMDMLEKIFIMYIINGYNDLTKVKNLPDKIRPFFKNVKFYDFLDGDNDAVFDGDGLLSDLRIGDYEYQYNKNGSVMSFKNNHGDIYYYTSDGDIISSPENLNKSYNNDGSITFYDKDHTPLYTKYNNGYVEYYDDTEEFLSSKNSRYRRKNIRKESFKCNQFNILLELSNYSK